MMSIEGKKTNGVESCDDDDAKECGHNRGNVRSNICLCVCVCSLVQKNDSLEIPN